MPFTFTSGGCIECKNSGNGYYSDGTHICIRCSSVVVNETIKHMMQPKIWKLCTICNNTAFVAAELKVVTVCVDCVSKLVDAQTIQVENDKLEQQSHLEQSSDDEEMNVTRMCERGRITDSSSSDEDKYLDYRLRNTRMLED
jgi:hypothetical protein